MRDWQYRSLEWLQGKTWEHATPVGPWLVTPDEVGGPDPDLDIRCEVDGVVRQASRTSELVFSPADLVAYASEFVTLEPGDLLLTGTPAGVGHGMRPAHVPRARPGGAHGHRAHRRARESLRAGSTLTGRVAVVTSGQVGAAPARYPLRDRADARTSAPKTSGPDSAPSASWPERAWATSPSRQV